MRTLFSLAYGIFVSSVALAQGWQPPKLPQIPQPATISRYDNFGQPNAQARTFNNSQLGINGQAQMGATAEDILRQSTRNNPYYGRW